MLFCWWSKKKVVEEVSETTPHGNAAWQALESDSARQPKISKTIYDRVKLASSLGIPEESIMRELGLSPRTVKDIVLSADWESFCKP